jgi:diguanylate cyclase (GGDEF)-like protein
MWSTHPVAPAGSTPTLRALMLRLGLRLTCTAFTLLGILVSLSLALVINLFAHRTPHDFWISLLTSVTIPALIAPPVTWLMMRLLLEAESARRSAERLAVTDPLTGAFNRRHFFVVGERRFAHARQLQEQVSLLLLDVDDFKAVNDQHGHAVGDRVLIAVAQACMACMRATDLLARYGGEEFVALLPGADMAYALQVAERVRTGVAGLQVLADNGATVRPTVSVGVAMLAAAPTSFDGLLAQADGAMYNAKRAGKNRVNACTVATPRDSTPPAGAMAH